VLLPLLNIFLALVNLVRRDLGPKRSAERRRGKNGTGVEQGFFCDLLTPDVFNFSNDATKAGSLCDVKINAASYLSFFNST
jgi:hypothetical protein